MRCAVVDRVEVFDGERDAKLVRDREQMQDGVGTAAGGADRGVGVLKCLARDDL